MHRKLAQLALCLLFATAQLIWAQAVGGTLSGKVTAASGAPVPNAAVTITNVSTGASQRALTGPDGTFSIAGLPPGTYKVDVESAGFKRTTQQNIELTTTGPAVVNVTLEAGNISQTVEIKAFAPVVQSENGQTGTGFDTRPVRQWPVIDRNHQELVGLYSGVTPPIRTFPPVLSPEMQRSFSVNGQSPLANWWYIDGATNQEPFHGGEIRVIPNEAIQQMNIVTSTYSAPIGFNGGSFVMTNMRGGTNDLHGSLFEFNRNDLFRNRNFFNTTGNPDPKVVYNQFGGTVGRSIIRDKLFFFGSYQGQYDRTGATQVATVPTAALRAGDFSAFPATTIYNPSTGTATGYGRLPFANNTIPSGLINPFSAALTSALPLPNLPGLENNYVGNNYMRDDAQNADARIDFHASDQTSAFLRYGYSNYGVMQTSILGPLGSDSGINRLVSQNAVASITHSFSANLIGDGRIAYNRYQMRQHPLVFGGPLPSSSSFLTPFSDVAPAITIEGMPGIGVSPAFAPTQGIDNTYQANTNWAMHTDKHNIKFGVDVINMRSAGFSNLLLAPGGASIFGAGATALAGTPGVTNSFANSYAAFLLGTPTLSGFSAYGVEPDYRTTQYGAFLMDTIHPIKNLTVELGVRYDVFSPVSPQNDGQAMFYNPANNTVSYSGIGGVGRNIRDYDLDNVSPRIGFAYAFRNKTVIRGGYSISYFQMPMAYDGMMPTVLGTSAGSASAFTVVPSAVGYVNGPNGTTFTTLPVPTPTVVGGVNAANLVNGTPAPNVPLSFVSPSRQTPYVQSFNLQVQQDLGDNLVLTAGYVGVMGRQLPLITNINAALPGTGAAGQPLAAFGRTADTYAYDSGLTNNYNALQVNLSKRFAHGLSFQGAYTYSKSLDYGSNGGALLNPFNRNANYGPSDYDRTHVLSIAHLWELPFGAGTSHLNHGLVSQIVGNWQLNGILHWAAGTPFTVLASPVPCNCPGITAVNANVTAPVSISGQSIYGQNMYIQQSALGAFSNPVNSFGNLGRNRFRGPSMTNYDVSLFRSFPIRDRYKLELRGTAFNVTNTPSFFNPVVNMNSTAFGQVTQNYYQGFGREFQVGARILF